MLQLEERFGILQPVKNTWLYASSGGVEHPLETMHGVGATYDLGDVTQACRANPLRFDCFTYRLWEDTGNWLVANPRLPGLFIDTTIDYFALNPNRWYPVGANGGSIGRDRLKATDWMVRGSVEMTSVLAQFHYIGELLPDYIGVASWRY